METNRKPNSCSKLLELVSSFLFGGYLFVQCLDYTYSNARSALAHVKSSIEPITPLKMKIYVKSHHNIAFTRLFSIAELIICSDNLFNFFKVLIIVLFLD